MSKYNPQEIEKKWQDFWEKNDFYKAEDFSKKPKKYILIEFPYPSGEGLHVGHARSYAALDAVSRKKRMEGYNVLFPIGWDAFGLPSENYAIKTGVHPSISTKKNIENYRKQLKSLGLSFDWSREINTTDPKYYKWTQWIFLKLFEKGLAYQAEIPINWCPSCKIGLANEEVVGGNCERCGALTEKKVLKQWMIKITAYADRLIDDLKNVDYPEKVKLQQINWIGKSYGTTIKFSIFNSQSSIDVFTTRTDTLFGVTAVVLALEHPLIKELITEEYKEKVEEYIADTRKKSDFEREKLEKEKTGVFTGSYCLNPVNSEKVPIWIGDYVVATYGGGAVMVVPAHDFRDYDFAKKYNIPIKTVIKPKNQNCIIVHGCPSKEEDLIDIQRMDAKHWIPWLKEELNKNGIETYAPLMPKAWAPKFEDWKSELEKLPINENTNLVGHSCAAPFLVRWLGISKKRIKKLILVAPAKIPRFDALPEIKDLYNFEIDTAIKERVAETIIFISNDEERIKTSAKIFAEALGGKIIEIKNKGHFVYDDMKTTEFPELLGTIVNLDNAFVEEGILANSDDFNGMESSDAIEKITEWLEKRSLGRKNIQYKLRDWVFSRQHYWGEPIPIIHCQKCGQVAVPEKDLPVELPYVEKYQPTGTGESPLAAIADWVNTKCPKCQGPAKRETDTMPNWAGSNWYYMRYCDSSNDKTLADNKKLKYWMPVDWYNGGFEHTTLHLLYSRFIYKFLFDIGAASASEPYQKRTSHGIVLAQDQRKMSKSFGNVINPDDIVKEFGADALRLYEMFMGPFDQAIAWSTDGMKGCYRFLEKVWNVVLESSQNKEIDKVILGDLHKLNKKIAEDLENLKFNTIVAAFMEFINLVQENKEKTGQDIIERFLILLSPFAPHIAEELWQKLGRSKSIFAEKWPEYDKKLIKEETITLVIQINGKIRDKVEAEADIPEEKAKDLAISQESVKKWIQGKEIKKVIFVPGKLINIVV